MCPSSSSSACLSSLHGMRRSGRSPSSGQSSSKSLAADPSRMRIVWPSAIFSRASSRREHSWSVSMPAETYASRSAPRSPGACPSTRLPYLLAISSFRITSGSRRTTPGKFIISARQTSEGSAQSSSMASGPITAPAVSNEVAGTHEGMPR